MKEGQQGRPEKAIKVRQVGWALWHIFPPQNDEAYGLPEPEAIVSGTRVALGVPGSTWGLCKQGTCPPVIPHHPSQSVPLPTLPSAPRERILEMQAECHAYPPTLPVFSCILSRVMLCRLVLF